MTQGTARLALLIVLLAAGLAAEPSSTDRPSKEDLSALPPEEREWLSEFVAPIILPEERKVFLTLTEPYQRESFKEDFWERREKPGLPPPLGPGYRYRYQELRALADEKYDGWTNDAGRMVLRWGEPTSILEPRCGGEDVFRGLEVWSYDNLGESGRGMARYIFYRPQPGVPRRLWMITDRNQDVFYPNSCRKSFDELTYDCRPSPGDRCAPCQDRCEVYKAYVEIRSRQGSAAGGMIEISKLFEPPKVSTEGIDREKDKWAATSDPNAKMIHIEGPSSGGTSATPIANAPTPIASPTSNPLRDLSPREIQERIARLEPKYKEWLDLARPLMTESELSRFLQISSAERDKFMSDFWKRQEK